MSYQSTHTHYGYNVPGIIVERSTSYLRHSHIELKIENIANMSFTQLFDLKLKLSGDLAVFKAAKLDSTSEIYLNGVAIAEDETFLELVTELLKSKKPI